MGQETMKSVFGKWKTRGVQGRPTCGMLTVKTLSRNFSLTNNRRTLGGENCYPWSTFSCDIFWNKFLILSLFIKILVLVFPHSENASLTRVRARNDTKSFLSPWRELWTKEGPWLSKPFSAWQDSTLGRYCVSSLIWKHFLDLPFNSVSIFWLSS